MWNIFLVRISYGLSLSSTKSSMIYWHGDFWSKLVGFLMKIIEIHNRVCTCSFSVYKLLIFYPVTFFFKIRQIYTWTKQKNNSPRFQAEKLKQSVVKEKAKFVQAKLYLRNSSLSTTQQTSSPVYCWIIFCRRPAALTFSCKKQNCN